MTDARIFMLDPANRRLLPMTSTNYVTEDQLQSYLADYPDLIPGDQIDSESPRRWLLVAREMGVPDMENAAGDRWSLDHLFLDQDGMPTFVEVKRAVDTRTRREVVAQMLDYAANGLEYWSLDRLRQSAAETAQRRGTTLDAQLLSLLQTDDPGAIDPFWVQVEENLRQGRVRLLFVVDQAPKELRRLAEFLNEKMADVQVLIVEIKQYTGAVGTALAPRVLGMTEAVRAQKVVRQRNRPMTHEEFFTECPPDAAQFFAQLIELAKKCGYTIAWNPTSWSVRLRHPKTQKWYTVLIIWRSSWDVNVYHEAFDAIAHGEGEKLRAYLGASGVFPVKTPTLLASEKPITKKGAGPLLDTCRYLLETGRDLFRNAAGENAANL